MAARLAVHKSVLAQSGQVDMFSSLSAFRANASFIARQNLIAVEVATIGNGLEFIDAESVLGRASDVCELRSI
jgi:hypothetical protein